MSVPLGSISEIRSGVGFPVAMQGKQSGKYPFVKVGDVSKVARLGQSDLASAANFVDEEDAAQLRAAPFPIGSIVFPKIGEAIRQNNRALVASPCLVDNNVMGVIPGSEVDAKYLFHFFRSFDLFALARSTTVPSIRKSDLERVKVPLPRTEEQRRLVQVLDQVESLRAKRRAAIALLDELRWAVLVDLFGDLGANDRDWENGTELGEVADIRSGITKGRKSSGEAMRSVPYLAVLNVQAGYLDLSVVKEIEATECEIDRYRLRKNDLLLTEGGDPDKLGRGTLWADEIPACIHQNHVFCVRLVDDSKIIPVFLSWLVASNRGKQYFARSAKQTTGIASINMTQLKKFPLVFPPMPLQQEFAARLDVIERAITLHQAHLTELDALFASLQDRAFRGTLWTEEPTPVA